VKDEDKAKEQLSNNQKSCTGIEKKVIIEETKKHKKKDESRSKSEAQCKNFFEYARDVIFTISPEGMITSLNPAFETITGWSRDEWIDKSFESIVHPDYLPLAMDIYQRTINGEVIPKFELRILAKSGGYLTFEFITTPLIHNVGALGIARNITERKKFEEALKQSEEEYRTLVENIQDGVIVIQDDKIQFASKTFVRTAGYIVGEVIGKEFKEFIAPEDLEMVTERYHRRQAGEDVPREYEFRVLHKDGRTRILFNANVGLITYRSKVASMVTMKNVTEKKKLEAQLLRAQRMESIGTLSGGIAHDLNNVLTPMMLSLQTLEEKFTDEQSQKLLTILERNLQRGVDLIKQVMSFARGIEGERKPLQVAHIISEVEKVAKETFPKNIEIETNISKDSFSISGDATQLHQVIMNLCVNARDAMPDGGVLDISVENFYVDESYARMNIESKVGQYIIITISDTGTGIPPETMDRIFEPFFTTKEHGKGTGLGLSTALGIVRSHSGFIDVQSEVGKGTKFKVYLPAIKTEIQKIEKHKLKLPAGSGELILIVEDEGLIRDITCTALEAHSYKVLIAENGEQAVVLYAQNKDKIKVILMDLMMPVMEGEESIRAIRKINPEVKIIAVSGLTDKDKLEKVSNYTNAFLPKPYTAERLLRTIHEVLSTK
jgi:two-component system cell cycle sensor histidine kinase/response regulator CckA